MALPEAVAGATRPTPIITWSRADGAPENLTSATLTGKIYDPHTDVARAIVGVLTVTDGPNGVFAWALHADDVATAGEFEVQFTATFGSAPSPAKTLLAPWTVHKAK